MRGVTVLLVLAFLGVLSTVASGLFPVFNMEATSISGKPIVVVGYGFPFFWRVMFDKTPSFNSLAFLLDVYFFMVVGSLLIAVHKRVTDGTPLAQQSLP